MPAQYERIRDAVYQRKLKAYRQRNGRPASAKTRRLFLKTAKRVGAATFNKNRKPGQAPVTRGTP